MPKGVYERRVSLGTYKVTPEIRKRIEFLSEAGFSNYNIAEMLHLSKTTVACVKNNSWGNEKRNQRKEMSNQSRPGMQIKLTETPVCTRCWQPIKEKGRCFITCSNDGLHFPASDYRHNETRSKIIAHQDDFELQVRCLINRYNLTRLEKALDKAILELTHEEYQDQVKATHAQINERVK